MGIILWLLFGAIVGAIAGWIMKDPNGMAMNIIVGILGSFVGSWLGSFVTKSNFTEFNLMGLIFSVIGACLLIFIKRAITGRGF